MDTYLEEDHADGGFSPKYPYPTATADSRVRALFPSDNTDQRGHEGAGERDDERGDRRDGNTGNTGNNGELQERNDSNTGYNKYLSGNANRDESRQEYKPNASQSDTSQTNMSLSISNDTVNQEDETNLSIVSGASNKRNENSNTNTFTNHNNISHIRNSNHNSHTNGNSNSNGNKDNNNFRVPTLPPHHSNHLNYSTLSGSFSDRAERAGDRERDRERDRDRGGADDFRASFDVNSSFASTFTSDSRTSDRGDRGGGGERERGDRERGERGIGGERGGGGSGMERRDDRG